MAKEDKKKKASNYETAQTVVSLREGALSSFKETHWNWFQWDSFDKGNHYLQVNKKTGEIQNLPQGVTIPFIHYIKRAVKNNIMRFRPKWQFIADVSDPTATEKAASYGLFMDKVWDNLQMSQLLRDGTDTNLTFSAAPYFMYWDDAKGDLCIEQENPFYFLPDPRSTGLHNARYIIRIVETDIISLRNNPKYDQAVVKTLVPERRMGATPIFERVIAETNKMGSETVDNDDNFTVYVTELYRKVQTEGGYKINLICECQSKTLYNEDTQLEDFPFEVLYCDKDQFSFYGQGWVKQLIPLNKILNKLATQKLFYIDRFRGEWVLPKGAKLEVGEQAGRPVVYYNAELRDKPEPAPVPAMPPIIENMTQEFMSYIKDFGGYTDVSIGKVPPGIKAAKALELLIQSDANNTVENKNNIEDFIHRITKKILWYYEHHLNMPTEFVLNDEETTLNPDGTETKIPKKLMAIGAATEYGQDLPDNSDPSEIIKIASNMNLRVSIESEYSTTEEGRKEEADKLYGITSPVDGMPLIDDETYLEMYKIGNIKDVMKRREEMYAKKRELEAQNPPPAPEPPKATVSVGFKDLPPSAQADYLTQLNINPGIVPQAKEEIAQQAVMQQQLQAGQQAPVQGAPEQPQPKGDELENLLIDSIIAGLTNNG